MKKYTVKDLVKLKVALVHDYFSEYGGAERVVEEIHGLFPQSVVHTAVINPHNLKLHWKRMSEWDFKVSWFGKIPFIRNYPSLFRFFTPMIWESFDLSGYDLVISSSGWFMCKGVITRPETVHISYVHHQNKFLTYYETPDDWQQNWLKRMYGYIVGTPLRMWDYIGSQRPDVLVANSRETKSRIAKYYRREAEVIYPPIRDPHVDIEDKLQQTDNYFITVNRLAKPKHVEVLIEAANETGDILYVVGKGKEFNYLKSIAHKNVIVTGEISDLELKPLLMGARGFLTATVDDEFGMAPVEAMMYGIPVIAYKSGGLKETVINGKNGLLVDELSPKAFVEAIKAFKKMDYEKLARSAHSGAKQYKSSIFREKMIQLALEQLNKHNA